MSNTKPDSHSTSYIPTSPAERYAQAIESGQFMPDEAQAQAVQELDRVWKELLTRYKASKKAFRRFRRQTYQKAYTCGVVLGVVRHGSWINSMNQCHLDVKLVCIFIILCNMCIKN